MSLRTRTNPRTLSELTALLVMGLVVAVPTALYLLYRFLRRAAADDPLSEVATPFDFDPIPTQTPFRRSLPGSLPLQQKRFSLSSLFSIRERSQSAPLPHPDYGSFYTSLSEIKPGLRPPPGPRRWTNWVLPRWPRRRATAADSQPLLPQAVEQPQNPSPFTRFSFQTSPIASAIQSRFKTQRKRNQRARRALSSSSRTAGIGASRPSSSTGGAQVEHEDDPVSPGHCVPPPRMPLILRHSGHGFMTEFSIHPHPFPLQHARRKSRNSVSSAASYPERSRTSLDRRLPLARSQSVAARDAKSVSEYLFSPVCVPSSPTPSERARTPKRIKFVSREEMIADWREQLWRWSLADEVEAMLT